MFQIPSYDKSAIDHFKKPEGISEELKRFHMRTNILLLRGEDKTIILEEYVYKVQTISEKKGWK
jgi:hypothetical protein